MTDEKLTCYGCGDEIPTDHEGMILIEMGEVGEFYNINWSDDHDPISVLAHVDCIGFTGDEDSPWRLA